jgi:LemA protein
MLITLVACSVVVLFLILLYNTLVARKNEVKNAFATIDAMLKKRFDLIPNLVASVKESTKFETSTLEKVIQMRSQGAPGTASLQQLQSMDKAASEALKGFFVQVEAYPDLKSNQNFIQLQNALQEVEDQLAASRRTFNAAVTNLNNALEMFPTNIVGNLFRFEKAQWIEIPEGERKNLDVGQLFKS